MAIPSAILLAKKGSAADGTRNKDLKKQLSARRKSTKGSRRELLARLALSEAIQPTPVPVPVLLDAILLIAHMHSSGAV